MLNDLSTPIPEEAFRGARSKEKHYAFDYSFDDNATQEEIYEKSVKQFIDRVIMGYNSTMFAYGATGAGKTYTMLGTAENPGIIPKVIAQLLECVTNDKDSMYQIKLSFLEVYNENIRDLLDIENKTALDLREDPDKGVVVAGITEIFTSNLEDTVALLKYA